MILMMVNNKIKQQLENQKEDEKRESEEGKDFNQIIKQMSVKLPRSESDEYESQNTSNDSAFHTSNKQ